MGVAAAGRQLQEGLGGLCQRPAHPIDHGTGELVGLELHVALRGVGQGVEEVVVDMVSELMGENGEGLPVLRLDVRWQVRPGEVQPADGPQELWIVEDVGFTLEHDRLAVVDLRTTDDDVPVARRDASQHVGDQPVHVVLRHEVATGGTHLRVPAITAVETRARLVLRANGNRHAGENEE
ncbi:MAG: hypothetical protein EBZ67_10835 [Chitinophagia bacterium]|nr:hypothetical protein [Chitinophagia bacterium]